MNLEQCTRTFIDQLEQHYFIKRDTQELFPYLMNDVSVLGTGEDEVSRNRNEVQTALLEELEEYSGSLVITEQNIAIRALSDTISLSYGKLHVVPQEQGLAEMTLQVTLICEATPDGMRVLHCHLAKPDEDQEQGHYYVSQGVSTTKNFLEKSLQKSQNQLKSLMQNIPGGVHCCVADEHFTLIHMSDSFLNMFGYTQEEIYERFQNRYLNMIEPQDREAVYQHCQMPLNMEEDFELEYRVRHKNGELIWVLDKGRLWQDDEGNRCFYCVLVEINDRKQAQEELRLMLERHELIMNQTNDIIFEWNIAADTLLFSSNWEKTFGYAPIQKKISNQIPLSENLHPDDLPIFMKLMQESAAGKPYSEAEFRLRHQEGHYSWYRVRATVQFDQDGKPLKAVGVIIDVSAVKYEREKLMEMAQRDALTGLYNKTAVQSRVEEQLYCADYTQKHALLIIDVDDFKRINDDYGHLTGDRVLINIGEALQQNFRSSDVIGRVGGDEFLVFLPNVTGEDVVQNKAENLLHHLNQIVLKEGEPTLSCSVGLVLAETGCLDYTTLYDCADQALYRQKNNGKNGICCMLR